MRFDRRTLVLAAAAALVLAALPAAAPAAAQGTVSVGALPYYSSNYWVGMQATWDPVPGASSYRVTHFRQDACGSASVTVTTTNTTSSSGTHPNCGAPTSCYFRQATVEALDGSGTVIATGSASFCEVGKKLAVRGEAYFSSGWKVGLKATWGAVNGAADYRVTQYRSDQCGSASVVTTTTGTSSSSGTHYNCGQPNSCYFREATVEARDSSGTVIATDSAAICEIGYP